MSINSILPGIKYCFWEFSFLMQSLLYVRQIKTINLPKTKPTHEQWPVQHENLSWRHAKNVMFVASRWSKVQFFLSRLWITIHYLKGICMKTSATKVEVTTNENTSGVTWFLKGSDSGVGLLSVRHTHRRARAVDCPCADRWPVGGTGGACLDGPGRAPESPPSFYKNTPSFDAPPDASSASMLSRTQPPTPPPIL